jgi:NitT/TauT family transport system substrate-binding protein
MALIQTRRRFLGGIAAAGAAGLLRARHAEAADGPLETTTVRLAKGALCLSTLYIAEEMLRAEGFTEIRYIEEGRIPIRPVTQGEVDFSAAYANSCVRAIDAGEPIMVLSGVMVGCFELFAREGIDSVTELKGKSIGVGAAGSLSQQLVTLITAQVGLDSVKDVQWVTDPSVKPIELFVQGKIDAFLGFPPRTPGSARPTYRSRNPRYCRGPAVVAIFLLHVPGQSGIRCHAPGRDQTRHACHPYGNGSLRD